VKRPVSIVESSSLATVDDIGLHSLSDSPVQKSSMEVDLSTSARASDPCGDAAEEVHFASDDSWSESGRGGPPVVRPDIDLISFTDPDTTEVKLVPTDTTPPACVFDVDVGSGRGGDSYSPPVVTSGRGGDPDVVTVPIVGDPVVSTDVETGLVASPSEDFLWFPPTFDDWANMCGTFCLPTFTLPTYCMECEVY